MVIWRVRVAGASDKEDPGAGTTRGARGRGGRGERERALSGRPGAASGPGGEGSARARLAMGQRRDRGGARWMEAGQEGPAVWGQAGPGAPGGDPGTIITYGAEPGGFAVRGCRKRVCVISANAHRPPKEAAHIR